MGHSSFNYLVWACCTRGVTIPIPLYPEQASRYYVDDVLAFTPLRKCFFRSFRDAVDDSF